DQRLRTRLKTPVRELHRIGIHRDRKPAGTFLFACEPAEHASPQVSEILEVNSITHCRQITFSNVGKLTIGPAALRLVQPARVDELWPPREVGSDGLADRKVDIEAAVRDGIATCSGGRARRVRRRRRSPWTAGAPGTTSRAVLSACRNEVGLR